MAFRLCLQSILSKALIRKSLFCTNSFCQSQCSGIQSSLYISGKDGFNQVLKPSFDSHYLTYVSDNLESIQQNMEIRGMTLDLSVDTTRREIKQFNDILRKVEQLKKERVKLLKKMRKKPSIEMEKKLDEIRQSLRKVRDGFYELEERVVPFLLQVPCAIRGDIQHSGQVIDQLEGCPNELLKQLTPISYVRLGYLNNIYHSSIVGPNAQFFIGTGAQMFYSLGEYLSDLFERSHFVPVNGLDIVKSALVEASNSKDVQTDPCILQVSHQQHDEAQNYHLTGEASIEALFGWLVKLPAPLVDSKFLQVGSGYADSLSQQHSIRATVLADSGQSEEAMQQLYAVWWKAFTELGLKCRSVRGSVGGLKVNEYAKYELQVWLHSQQQWLVVAEVTHHWNYLLQRLGSPQHLTKHVLSSHVDLALLLKCIFEHYQDPATGKVNYPQCLVNFSYE